MHSYEHFRIYIWFTSSTSVEWQVSVKQHEIQLFTDGKISVNNMVAVWWSIWRAQQYKDSCNDTYSTSAYGVYITQLIRNPRANGYYPDFLDRGLLLSRKLLNQGVLLGKLKSSFPKFCGRHHDLTMRYDISLSYYGYVPRVVSAYHRHCNYDQWSTNWVPFRVNPVYLRCLVRVRITRSLFL